MFPGVAWEQALTRNFHVKADSEAQTGDSLTRNFHVKADRGAQTGLGDTSGRRPQTNGLDKEETRNVFSGNERYKLVLRSDTFLLAKVQIHKVALPPAYYWDRGGRALHSSGSILLHPIE